MKRILLVAAALILMPISAFSQSSFTVYTNAPPASNGIDEALAALIDTAGTSVDAAVYSLQRQTVIDALFNAHSRGVTVRIVTEKDSYDSDSYGPSYQYLETAGIPIVTDNAGGGGTGLMHDKFYIIDSVKVWTGSYNATNNGTVANANNGILIENASLAGAYAAEFEEMFTYYYFGSQKSDNTGHSFTIDGYEVESHFSPTDGVHFQIQSEIAAAAHSIYFMIYSFTDDTVGNALVSRYDDGLIVQGAFDYGQRNQTGGEYQKLRNAGIPVKVDEYPGLLHHKVLIFDPGQTDCAVITGSSNWSASAFGANDEDIVIVRHPGVVAEYYDLFRDIYDNHCVFEGGSPVGALVISEIMSKGAVEDIASDDRSNWAESIAADGSPGEEGEPDTLPPVIVHTPVDRALLNRPVSIHCEIYDPNDPDMYSAKEPTLYYRQAGDFVFQTAALGAFFGNYSGSIPGSEVTTDGVEYYLSARDWSYNLATSPAFSAQSDPYQVVVTDNPDAVIRFTELMYDPPGELPDESVLEWTEIYNASSTRTVNLAGWQFTDGEGTYVFPAGASISPGEYQVLCKTTSGPSGSFTRYVYGPDSVGEITFNNPLGVVTDQLILKDPSGLIVEEVDYSANWGASNVKGPNNHTLEKLDPEGPDDETNWMYSMVEGGTPGAASSPHFIFHKYETESGWKTTPGIWINPTLIEPGQEECTISYRLDRDCDVTIKVYNPPFDTPPAYCYDSAYFLVTLADADPKTANLDPDLFAAHTAVWDGTYSGQTAVGACRIVLWAVDTSAQTSICDSADQFMYTKYHKVGLGYYNCYTHEPVAIYFYQSKPATVSLEILKNIGPLQWTHCRDLVEDIVMPRPADGSNANVYYWDGRDDDGKYMLPGQKTMEDLTAEDIFGNVVIVRPRLRLFGLTINPRSYFDPNSSDPARNRQTIGYAINQDALVRVRVRDGAGGLVATPLDWTFQTAGSHSTDWDGAGNTGNGIYSFSIEAKSNGQAVEAGGNIALYSF